MPLPMVHLAVAYNIMNMHPCIDKPEQYYLGAISPEAVHMRINNSNEDKDKSHLYTRNSSRFDEMFISYRETIIKFISSQSQNEKFSFILGYGVHLLTDIYWLKSLYRHYRYKYEADIMPSQNIREAYYNDTDQLDFLLYKNYSWINEVWNLLIKAHEIDMEDMVTAEEVRSWKVRTLNWYSGISRHNDPIRYITIEDLLAFIDEKSKKIYKDVSALL